MLFVRLFTIFAVCLGLVHPLMAQSNYLQSGPMVGYSTMMEVLLWVQTNAPANVQIKYWDELRPNNKLSTEEVQTNKRTAFTAKLLADKVEPGNKYVYELSINGKKVNRPYPLKFQTQTLWQWRTDPPDFKMVIGSCAYVNDEPYDRPGAPYGAGYQIFTQIHDKQPELMLWLGDNVYLREADWNSITGIHYRNTHTRSLPELQALLGSSHHYAIWDDHDFGPNNSDRGLWNKEWTLEAFKLFWGNPSFGVNGQPGITTQFQWADVQFFLLDNRYYRTPNNRISGKRSILGEQQFEWLIDALVKSAAPFKVVAIGGQFLNPVAGFEHHAIFADERDRLLKAIEQENITGVIFFSGDVHHTELSKLERRGTYPIYDLTISPLTAGPVIWDKPDANYLRIPETLVVERNFALLEFSGKRTDRQMKITDYNVDGKELWNYTIKARDLR